MNENEVVPKAYVTTGMIILLKATAHGQDLHRVVQDMDVLDWEPDRLKSKLKGTLAKLIDKKEMDRVLRSKDTIAGIRFLGRRLTDKYEGIPLIKTETRKRKKPSRESLEAAPVASPSASTPAVEPSASAPAAELEAAIIR